MILGETVSWVPARRGLRGALASGGEAARDGPEDSQKNCRGEGSPCKAHTAWIDPFSGALVPQMGDIGAEEPLPFERKGGG